MNRTDPPKGYNLSISFFFFLHEETTCSRNRFATSVATDHEENRGKQSAEISATGYPKCLTVAFYARWSNLARAMQITLPPNCTPSLHDPPFSKLNPRDRNIDGKFNKRIEKEKWFHSIDTVSHENGRVQGTAGLQRQLCLFRWWWWWWSIWMEIMRSCVHTRRRPSASLRYPPRLHLTARLVSREPTLPKQLYSYRMVSSFRGISLIFRLDRYRDAFGTKVIRACFAGRWWRKRVRCSSNSYSKI